MLANYFIFPSIGAYNNAQHMPGGDLSKGCKGANPAVVWAQFFGILNLNKLLTCQTFHTVSTWMVDFASPLTFFPPQNSWDCQPEQTKLVRIFIQFLHECLISPYLWLFLLLGILLLVLIIHQPPKQKMPKLVFCGDQLPKEGPWKWPRQALGFFLCIRISLLLVHLAGSRVLQELQLGSPSTHQVTTT